MSDLTPRQSQWPLRWPDFVLDLQDLLVGDSTPVYIVGGAVRDALLSRAVKDIDLVTPESGIQLARQIANRMGGDFFKLDADRDVGRALINTPQGRLVIDVARFRGDDLLADLTDRDFTLNAMAVDLHGDLGKLIDPLGGEKDAITKVIRRCSAESLTHDPIRALRAVRQSVQLGANIEPNTKADIRAVAGGLHRVSPERIRDELFKILALSNAARALRVADTLGLLVQIIPEITPLHGLKQNAPHAFDAWEHSLQVIDHLGGVLATVSYERTEETAARFNLGMIVMSFDRYRARLHTHIQTLWPDERSHRALMMLAALLHETGKPDTIQQNFANHAERGAVIADAYASSLRLSNGERQRLVAVVRHHTDLFQMHEATPIAIHRFWRATGEAGIDVCLFTLANYLGMVGNYFEQDQWILFLERIQQVLSAYFEQYERIVEPPVLLDGKQLMRLLNLRSGPVIGDLLDAIREAQVAGEVYTVDDALRVARDYLSRLT